MKIDTHGHSSGAARTSMTKAAFTVILLIAGTVGGAAIGRAGRGNPFSGASGSPETNIAPGIAEQVVELVPQYSTTSKYPGGYGAKDRDAWTEAVPEIEAITIESKADGSAQNAFFYDSGSDREKPLLVVLHSWSTAWLQNISIPYAVFAAKNDWVFIHPDHRGLYDDPDAVASELVVQDILDAVDYARRNARIDESRIHLAGYSGGALTSLVMAGRHPEIWAGVVAWVPIFDLQDWYTYNSREHPDRHYAGQIAAACGGAPEEGSEAAAECLRRSPRAHLSKARGSELRVFLASGLTDDIVPPDHPLRAYNELARPEDRIPEETIAEIRKTRTVPEALRGASDDRVNALFAEVGLPVVVEKKSGNAHLYIFDGGHDVIFNAGLLWLSRQRRGSES